MNALVGQQIMVDANLVVKRSLRERLFTRPWRPFVKFKPDDRIYCAGGYLLCHPCTAEILRARAGEEKG